MNDSPPFDLLELRNFLILTETGNFTRAASVSGLSQSALTRQIQNLEGRLGLTLLNRTTRSVQLTAAGEFWREKATHLLDQADGIWSTFRQEHLDAPPRIAVGVCKTIGLAHLPGFFHRFQRREPACQIKLSQISEQELADQLEVGMIDVAILPDNSALPTTLDVLHRFEDGFVEIGPPTDGQGEEIGQPIIQIDSATTTNRLIADWLKAQGRETDPLMEFDTFDLIINTVAMGLGRAIVPHRSLAIYSRSRKVERRPLPTALSRTVAVMVRRDRNRPELLRRFVDAILF